MQIENPLFKEFCQTILHNIEWIDPPSYLLKHKKYTEEHHYHVMKVVSDEYDRIKNTVTMPPTNPYEQKRLIQVKKH